MLVLTAAAAVAACLATARSLPAVQGWVVITCRSGRNVTRNAAWRVMTPSITRNAPEHHERYAASRSSQLQLATHPA
jgi:hypothetical protein